MKALGIHRLLLVYIFCRHLSNASAGGGQIISLGSFEFWLYLAISTFLVLFAGICSGLTVGYLSIKKQTLQLWVQSPDQHKVKVAQTILSVLQNHHLLLSTLLLSNALAMEALPIFLDKIVPAYLAILISTLAVLIFGEVIPQAYCTGPHQIPIAYYLSPLVKFLQFIFAIFVRPITWFLDNWLGHHQDNIKLTKDNLKTLLQLHKSKQLGYTPQQIELLQNTLDLRSKKVENYMIQINKIYMLEMETPITLQLLKQIGKYNFSTIAVYHGSRDRIVGVTRIKQLLGAEPQAGKKLKDYIKIQPVVFIHEGRNLLEVFDMLKRKKTRFCFILREQNPNKKYFTFSQSPQGKTPLGMVNMKTVFQQITLKQFKDLDKQKSVRSGQFGAFTIHKLRDPEQGVQQV